VSWRRPAGTFAFVRGVLAISVVAAGLAGLGACFAVTASGAVRTLDAKAEDVDALHGVVVWHATAAGAEC
jgi:hypothetical protein